MKDDLRWLRLRAVWLLVIPFLWLARPTPGLLLIGGVLTLVGLAIRAWAAGFIIKERELMTQGPYALTRNPLYLGSFLIGVGVTVAGASWVFVVLFVLFFAVVYGKTMRSEADLLEGLFGERYRAYARAVPLVLPRPTPYRESDSTRATFTVKRWRQNREYEALLGAVAGFAALALKMTLG